MTVVDKLQRTFNNLPQEKKDRINKILENYEEAIFATPHEPRNEEKLVQEITTLREQVEKLTKELDNVKQVEFPRRVQKVTDALKRKHEKELAALAEQNEKLREALTKWRYLDSSYNWRCGSCGNRVEGGHKESCALFLTNLATPVLNRIKGNK